MEELHPQIRSIIMQDVILRCKAVSDEILDIAYIWTFNDMPLLNSNSELIGHVVSNILNVFNEVSSNIKHIILRNCLN